MFCGTSPGTVLSKSLIQLSVDGLCSLPVGWPHCGGGDEGSGDLLRKVPCTHCCTQRPQPRSSHRRPTPPPETGHSRASLGKFLVGSLLLSPGSCCIQGFVCALQESVSPVVCKFWRLYSGVNGDLLQEGLCHTQICCTQSSCLCGRPLLTCTSTGDAQTLFWLNLCGVSGSWCTQGMFEPSKCL